MTAGLIAVFGALGVLARYGTGLLLPAGRLPWATLTVNLAGCFLAGLVFSLTAHSDSAWRTPVIVGFLGGFTTFSAFSLEALSLAQGRSLVMASLYITLSVVGGLIAAWAGIRLGG